MERSGGRVRKRHETQEDLDRESRAATIICGVNRCTFTKLNENNYKVDWAFYRGSLVGWGEYKRRFCDQSKYKTIFLSLAKWMKGMELSDKTGVPFVFYVEWDNSLFWYKGDIEQTKKFEIARGGRTDRNENDLGDIEPMIHIPTELFKKVSNG